MNMSGTNRRIGKQIVLESLQCRLTWKLIEAKARAGTMARPVDIDEAIDLVDHFVSKMVEREDLTIREDKP